MNCLWILAVALLLKGGEGHDFWSAVKEQKNDPWTTESEALRYHVAGGVYKYAESDPSYVIKHKQREETEDPSKVAPELPHFQQYRTIRKEWAKSASAPKQPAAEPILSELYDGEPATWPCFYKNCRGESQSPINIDTQVIKFKSELGPLSFHNYDKALNDLKINVSNGETVTIYIPEDKNVMVSSKWLKGTYRLYKMVFVWSLFGSSHTVDSKYFPMELFLSHLNTKYDNPDVDKPDALLDVNVFFKIGKEDNEALNPILETFNRINYPDANTTITTPIKIKDYLPKHVDAFVTYNGSKIVPNCAETRRYVIFDYASNISKQQLQQFKTLTTTIEKKLKPEHKRSIKRHIQALNNREIWGSIPTSVPKKQHRIEQFKDEYYEPWKW